MFYKHIYKLGSFIRNPSKSKHLDFLQKSNDWPLTKLQQYQLLKLKEITNYAFEKSNYYNNYYTKSNFHPSQILSLDDLKKIPIIKKEDLIKYNSQIHTVFKGKKFLASTSGSSGQSLKFFRDESADSFNRAVLEKNYLWYLINPWERNGYFWGFNFSFFEKIKTIFFDSLQNRFRVFSYDKVKLIKFVNKLSKASYVHGYSSMIYQVAKLINEKRLPKPKKIKMVKGTSEKIYESYHDEVIKAFGSKIISEYGAAESGIIAFECPEGKMHVNMEGVIVEEVENEIIVTNLHMKSFPIIRYKLGDYIELSSNSSCKCGRSHILLNEVTGRIGSNVYGYNGIYPSLVFYYIFKNLSNKHFLKLNYQITQKKKGNLLFRIEEILNQNQIKKLNNEVIKYFGSDIEFSLQMGCEIISGNEKLKSFISYI